MITQYKTDSKTLAPIMQRFLAVILIASFLSACASSDKKPQEDQHLNRQQTLSAIKRALEPTLTDSKAEQIPQEITSALMPSYKGYSNYNKKRVEEERFDISVKGTYARSFFMGLVKGTAINMVVHPKVAGKISLSLKNVSIKDILEITREIYGYEFKKQSNGYLILPAKMQSKIFQVNYLNVSREGESHVSVNSGQLSGSDSDSSDSSGSSSASSSSQITTKSTADFWADLEKSIINIIGETEGRSVVVSPQSGIVVVRAMPNELRDVQTFLDAAQKSLHRQVIIEAKIIEVTLNEASKTGIDWAIVQKSGSNTVFLGAANVTDGTAQALTSTGLSASGLSNVGDAATYSTGGMFALGAQTSNFAAMFQILDTQGDAQVLSSPRIATLNNQKAVIKVGSDEFFVTGLESATTTTGTTSTTSSPTVIIKPFFSGIALDVTPQITDNGQIILHIHPQVSEVKDQVKTFTISGSQQSLPLALSSVRESDSIIKAKSGQIIVIGGLMQEKTEDQNADNFGLADVPLIGGMFKQGEKSKIQSELVILLKPIIIEDDSQWDDEVNNSNHRINQFYQ